MSASVTGSIVGRTDMCLVLLLAGVAPRAALILVWIFSDLVDRAFTNFFVPLLGLLILPYTTLFYVLAWSPVVGVGGWGWVFVTLGVLLDIAQWVGGGATARRR
jgi:hypothetical protein